MGLASIAQKDVGKSAKILAQIFINDHEDIIYIHKWVKGLWKSEATDYLEFFSFSNTRGLDSFDKRAINSILYLLA